MSNTFRKENVLSALRLAIKDQELYERQQNYTSDSALLAGWRELYNAVENGEDIEIIE